MSDPIQSARLHLESAARRFVRGDTRELEQAALEYRAAVEAEEARVVTVSLDEIDEEESTKEYPVGMELPL